MRPLLLALLPLLAAHQPSVAGTELSIEDPYISYAVNGSFASGDEVYTISLTYDRGFAIPFELLTEKRAGLEEFRPAYAIVGPGLPTPDADTLAALPKSLPDGAGAWVDLNDAAERLVIFESVMRRFFYSSGPIAVAFDPGAYELWVWSPAAESGDFVLGFGVEEDFSGGYGGVFADWSTYAY